MKEMAPALEVYLLRRRNIVARASVQIGLPRKYACLVTQLYTTLCDPWTVACQAPLSMRFSGKEYWSGLPFLPPADLPDPGIEPRSPVTQADSLPLWSLGRNLPRKCSM